MGHVAGRGKNKDVGDARSGFEKLHESKGKRDVQHKLADEQPTNERKSLEIPLLCPRSHEQHIGGSRRRYHGNDKSPQGEVGIHRHLI